jgi:hypothetical protein
LAVVFNGNSATLTQPQDVIARFVSMTVGRGVTVEHYATQQR